MFGTVSPLECVRSKKLRAVMRVSGLLALLGVIVYLIVDFSTEKNVLDVLEKFLQFVQDAGVGGAVLLALVYAVATVLFVPGALLTIGAGFVLTATNNGNTFVGTLVASCVVLVGATIGSVLAFLIGRFLLRDFVYRWVQKYKVFYAIDRAIGSNALTISFLLRLSPILPFNVLNYLFGVTRISLRQYCISFTGVIPGTVAYCFIGSSLQNLSDVRAGGTNSKEYVYWPLLAGGIVTAAAAVLLSSIYARRELNRRLEEKPTVVRALSSESVITPDENNAAEEV